MKINGKEIGFEYTIGAFCDFSDYCASNPEVSMARAQMYKALFMNRAYTETHEGAEAITIDEIMHLSQGDYAALMDAIKKAEDAGKKRTVETVDTKKNGSRQTST